MKFRAKIEKVGVNPCVEVPERITRKMKAEKGYIPASVTINGKSFYQTLCPVKNAPYRLYVNGVMISGSGVKVGDTVTFTIVQSEGPLKQYNLNMPPELKDALKKNKLTEMYEALTPSRQREILKYLNSLKSRETLQKNITKLITRLQQHPGDARIP